MNSPETFVKKPISVQAIQWIGSNFIAVDQFIGDTPHATYPADGRVEIQTLEGTMLANRGDWILKGVKGEFWPVREDIFAETYSKPPRVSEGQYASYLLSCARSGEYNPMGWDEFKKHRESVLDCESTFN